jgi:hypothetical protein
MDANGCEYRIGGNPFDGLRGTPPPFGGGLGSDFQRLARLRSRIAHLFDGFDGLTAGSLRGGGIGAQDAIPNLKFQISKLIRPRSDGGALAGGGRVAQAVAAEGGNSNFRFQIS